MIGQLTQAEEALLLKAVALIKKADAILEELGLLDEEDV